MERWICSSGIPIEGLFGNKQRGPKTQIKYLMNTVELAQELSLRKNKQNSRSMGNSNASEIQIARCQRFKSLKAIGVETITQSRLISGEKITVQYGTTVKVVGKAITMPDNESVEEYSQAEGGRFALVEEVVINPEQFKDQFPL